MAFLQCTQKKNEYSFHSDEDVIFPVLKTELIKGAESLIQKGVSPQLIKKVFQTVCDDMVIKKIEESAISMKDVDMKGVLSTYYATQLPKKLFGLFRKHIADIIVGAVHASGYHYKGLGPFDASISDFEDGFDLIEINKVSGGRVDNSFYVEGIAFKPHVDGFEKLDLVERPTIMLLNIKPVQKSQKKDTRVDINIIDILENHVKSCPNVVLSRQAIHRDAKKELAKRGIYFADLVSEDDLDRVSHATCAKMISSNHPLKICIATCKRFQQKKFGNEVFGIFSGCSRGKAATIVLRGDDQFIEEAEMYVLDLIPIMRGVMKDYTLVAGGHALYDNIIQCLSEEANQVDEDSKRIMKAFTKAIQAVSDKSYDNDGSNPSQKHAVALGEGDTVWEPPSVKIHAICHAVYTACYAIQYPK